MKRFKTISCVFAMAAGLAQAPVTQEAKPAPAAESRAVREAPSPAR
jgi:hypothetical protein